VKQSVKKYTRGKARDRGAGAESTGSGFNNQNKTRGERASELKPWRKAIFFVKERRLQETSPSGREPKSEQKKGGTLVIGDGRKGRISREITEAIVMTPGKRRSGSQGRHEEESTSVKKLGGKERYFRNGTVKNIKEERTLRSDRGAISHERKKRGGGAGGKQKAQSLRKEAKAKEGKQG